MRWMGCVAHNREMSGANRVLVGKPEGKRTLGRPRHRLKHTIKINIQKIG
jgi:hypothetical protein